MSVVCRRKYDQRQTTNDQRKMTCTSPQTPLISPYYYYRARAFHVEIPFVSKSHYDPPAVLD
jgi:hypothetical protein